MSERSATLADDLLGHRRPYDEEPAAVSPAQLPIEYPGQPPTRRTVPPSAEPTSTSPAVAPPEAAPTPPPAPAGESPAHTPRFAVDPLIVGRVIVGEDRVSPLGKVQTVVDIENGVYGITEGMGRTFKARKAARAASRIIAERLAEEFDPAEPERSMHRALSAGDEAIHGLARRRFLRVRRKLGATASYMKLYQDADGNLREAHGNIGDGRLLRGTDGQVGRLTHGSWRSGVLEDYLGNRHHPADARLTVGTGEVRPGDRFALISNEIDDGFARQELDRADMETAFDQDNPQAVAEAFVRRSGLRADRAAVVVDIYDPDKTVADEAPDELMPGTTAEEPLPPRPRRWWQRTPLTRRFYREEEYGVEPKRHRAIKMLGAGAAAGALAWWYTRGARRHERETLRYAGRDMTYDEIHEAENRRKMKKAAIILGTLAAAGVGAYFLKRAGMDVVPSYFDGDGIDLLPVHGKSHYHATSPGDPRDGFWGWLWDDDPPFPNNAGNAGMPISPPGRHLPPYTPPPSTGGSTGGGIGGGATGGGTGAEAPAVVVTQPFVVQHGNGFDAEIQDFMSAIGHPVSPEKADQIYLDLVNRVGPHDILNIRGHSASNVYPVHLPSGRTDWRIVMPTDGATWTPDAQKVLLEDVPAS